MLQYLGGRRQESRTRVLQPAMHPHVPPPPAPRACQCCHFTPKTEISPFCDDPKSKWPKIMMWREAGGGGGGSAPPGLECRMQEQCSQDDFCPQVGRFPPAGCADIPALLLGARSGCCRARHEQGSGGRRHRARMPPASAGPGFTLGLSIP